MTQQALIDPSLTVQQFTRWWMKHKPIRPPFIDGIFYTDIAASVVLFREGPFQVELYISKPDSRAPYHSHDKVDSVLMYLTGNMVFGKNNVEPDLSEFQKPHATIKDAHFLFGECDYLKEGESHNLTTKEEGGCFFSFEKWHDRAPDSVTVNWVGELTGDMHKARIANANTTSNAS
jgi:hypothetical protein